MERTLRRSDREVAMKGRTLLVISILALCTHTLANVSDGLVAYYPFDGNADGESGNNIDGTPVGAELAADRMGNLKSAYGFDGDDDYISAPDSEYSGLTGDFTVAFWVMQKVGGGNELMGKHKKHVNTDHSWFIFLESDGQLVMEVYHNNGPGNPRISWSRLLEKGIWTHVALSYDVNSSTYITYINGCEDSSGVKVLDILDTSHELRFGTQEGGATGCFAGLLDDVRIYDRVLPGYEIELLAGTAGPSFIFTSYYTPLSATDGLMAAYVVDNCKQCECINWWFMYSEMGSGVWTKTPVSGCAPLNNFVYTHVSGLKPDTQYWIRAYGLSCEVIAAGQPYPIWTPAVD